MNTFRTNYCHAYPWKHLDLLITCKDPRFAVVVENKVDSQEHSDQLNRYRETMTEHHPGIPALHVYLTPDGEEPSEESWLPYTYTDLHRVLKRVRDTYLNAIGDEVRVFLDHYLNLLGTRFMNDEKLDELCRRIYKNHRQALDLIWERVGGPQSGVLAEVVHVLEDTPHWHVLHRSSNFVDIVPQSWLKWLPPFGPDDYYPFCVTIRSRETDLICSVFVGPMKDAAKRTSIVTELRDKSPGCGFKRSKAYKLEGDWNRISAVETLLEWGDDEELEPLAIRETARKKLDALFARLVKLEAVFKPLCLPSPA